jgi:hypothetical protein
MATFSSSLKSRFIYVFAIHDEWHKDCLKIGETTLEEDEGDFPQPNSDVLNRAARKRIDEYTQTAGIAYQLLYTEMTVFFSGGQIKSFNDKQVHEVLRRSGIKKKTFDKVKGANEWYCCDLETVKRAIQAVKHGKTSLNSDEISHEQTPIVFRPEQRDAIDRTIKQFKKGDKMLWNAKMRFGKTLSALQVVKEEGYARTLILTHRPVVDEGWYEDFHKIFYDRKDYYYGSRTKGESFESLQHLASQGNKYVYFASMQDLRGSDEVGGKFDKDSEIYSTPWDMLIIDEAHEGTKTELGTNVIEKLTKEHTKVLRLSGTPFNLLDDYKENEIFTWDYIMEQKAKSEWDLLHMGDPNPYAGLPQINIYTYDLGQLMDAYADDEKAFNFREFFRTHDDGTFIHDHDVDNFLDLLCKDDKDSLYPYSCDKFRKIFRHTLWIVPGVAAARALSAKLKAHPVFGMFKVVNVAGNGDEDEENADALQMVNDAIGPDPGATWTITLSCGKLTTGVSIKPWTAVFMMAGSYSTSAASYMQTIFRVQTPFTYNGQMKTECYAFDFAPDRTLRVLADVAHVSVKVGKQSNEDRKVLGEFLNFCPIISVSGSQMKPYDVKAMMSQLKRAQIERVVQGGFEDGALYNDELLKLDEVELNDFKNLKGIIGSTKAMAKTADIDVNKQGFSEEEYEEKERLEKKHKKDLTPEEKARLEQLKNKQNQRKQAISILRGISIRMPLLIYGADLKNEKHEITIDNFADIVDNASWKEFMPQDVTKRVFAKFKKYYDPDVFREAGKRIREMARAADKFTIEERILRIATIFNTFRNPDKETVLTPWRVVNMHMSDCLGGWCFYDKDFKDMLDIPRYISHHGVTDNVFATDSHILEINSKSGLYPLYCAYNIYRSRVEAMKQKYGEIGHAFAQNLWDTTIEQNIFVVCKTPMAVSITRRTLAGFRDVKVNAVYYPDIIENLKKNPASVVNSIKNAKHFWNIENVKEMKFRAVVGNPPYQVMDGGGSGSSAIPIYNVFVELAKELGPSFISMIMPAKWYSGGKGLDEFRKVMLNDRQIRALFDFEDSRDCFPTVDIAGGVCYFLWQRDFSGKCEITNVGKFERLTSSRYLNEFDTFIRNPQTLAIIDKVKGKNKSSFLSDQVYSRKPFGFTSNEHGSTSSSAKNNIQLFGSDGISYVSEDDVTQNKQLVGSWKVIMSKAAAEHAGQTDSNGRKKIIARLEVLPPRTICTESYLLLSAFDKEEDANNMKKYMQTQFVRFLLSSILITQNIAKDKFAFVPLQDFTPSSDIDWSQSVADIDRQLYKKYGLTDEETAFIERTIKPME